jgi:hypothetical protein
VGSEDVMSRLRAVFSVTELAELANISRQRMGRILHAVGVPRRRLGKKRFIFLRDVKPAAPELWKSTCNYQELHQPRAR